jgi:hypothetical protein
VVPAGARPGTYLSRVSFFTEESLNDGQGGQEVPDEDLPGVNYDSQAAQIFDIKQPMQIFKYNDLNGNGAFNGTHGPPPTGEPGLNDWHFTVTGPGGYSFNGDTSGANPGFLALLPSSVKQEIISLLKH